MLPKKRPKVLKNKMKDPVDIRVKIASEIVPIVKKAWAKSQEKVPSGKKRSEYDINLKVKDMLQGKLKKESQIMVDNPVTTYKGMIRTIAGGVTKEKLGEVKEKTAKLYSL